ncbi:MAG: alginate lyase family protein, partial [Proteobacteria bacterium]
TGVRAPLGFGKAIDYRDSKIVGDIKYLWEPGRHLELVTLALAYRITGQRQYASGALELLQSWFKQCPYPKGVHWISSLELGIRLVNWAFTWHLLGGANSPLFATDEGKSFLDVWLTSIYQHCHFINGHFSRYSSANNHLFGEYMGLFVASITWPCWPESEKWSKIAFDGLEEEAVRQNTIDGVNKEQAIYYQHEVMDMMLISHIVGATSSRRFSANFYNRFESLANFIASIMDSSGNVPMIGDADDALMVRLSYSPRSSPYRSLLGACAVLFDRSDFKKHAGLFDEKNRLLFGEPGIVKWDALSNVGPSTPQMTFPEGGYFILGSRFGHEDEVKAVFDCGPLGYLSIAAHGHADALALTLSVAGEQMLIDPGTFAYHTEKVWRDYFRGTSAHNTIRVDQLNQSQIGGNFMWLSKATS